jgi:hypothetical protein
VQTSRPDAGLDDKLPITGRLKNGHDRKYRLCVSTTDDGQFHSELHPAIAAGGVVLAYWLFGLERGAVIG